MGGFWLGRTSNLVDSIIPPRSRKRKSHDITNRCGLTKQSLTSVADYLLQPRFLRSLSRAQLTKAAECWRMASRMPGRPDFRGHKTLLYSMNRAVGEGRRRGPSNRGVLLAGAGCGAALRITALVLPEMKQGQMPRRGRMSIVATGRSCMPSAERSEVRTGANSSEQPHLDTPCGQVGV